MTEQKNILKIIRANYLQPAFLICAGVLMLSAGAMSAVINIARIYTQKELLSLKAPLNQMDISKLMPYKVVAKQVIDNPDELETLGTEDYIQWNLEDASAPADSKTRFCMLFITYYGLPDKVPHVPEECYIGGGFRTKNSEPVKLTIKKGDTEDEITARYLEFAGTQELIAGGESTLPVLYVFSANGRYAGGREEVRRIMNSNLFGKYSYFSKIEWSFSSKNSLGQVTYPKKQEALSASEKLLAVILPILEKEHWPHPDNSGW
ncbi:MAG: exosortase-associated EpsI family protein [Sedimentisphaerales bacterium]|nr:exosortase-associated EpsI family protein [Sedimentisphaerales bacterium]